MKSDIIVFYLKLKLSDWNLWDKVHLDCVNFSRWIFLILCYKDHNHKYLAVNDTLKLSCENFPAHNGIEQMHVSYL